MTPNEFLAWEREQPGRHDYIDGQIVDISGGSARHNALGPALIARLCAAEEGAAYRVLSSHQKLGVAEAKVVYADASVVRGPIETRAGAKDVLTNPVLVVEVLSKTTEAYDRGDKRNAYFAVPSIKHVVHLSQTSPHVELYTREDDGSFRITLFEAGSQLTLEHPAVTIPIDALYAGVFDLPGDD